MSREEWSRGGKSERKNCLSMSAAAVIVGAAAVANVSSRALEFLLHVFFFQRTDSTSRVMVLPVRVCDLVDFVLERQKRGRETRRVSNRFFVNRFSEA
jgi:hypothetical protein